MRQTRPTAFLFHFVFSSQKIKARTTGGGGEGTGTPVTTACPEDRRGKTPYECEYGLGSKK